MDIRGRKMKKPPACVQCRKRKIGCDRVKPVCGHCVRSGKNDCFYPDVPGQYTPSVNNNVGSSKVMRAQNSPAAEGVHYPTPGRPPNRPKVEANVNAGDQGSDFASMEQIREYNTRLQLINAQDRKNTPVSMESAKFVPRTAHSKMIENKPVVSASGEDLKLNWIQGPALFEMSSMNYQVSELFQAETEFIKLRLMELQEITGEHLDIDLSKIGLTPFSTGRDNKSNIDNDNELQAKKKIKLASQLDGAGEEINEIDTELLDSRYFFTILNANDTSSANDNYNVHQNLNLLTACKIYDVPNCMFNINFFIKRDKFLEQLYKKLDTVISEQFIENLTQLSQSLLASSPIIKEQKTLQFPSRVFAKDILDHFATIVDAVETRDNIKFAPVIDSERLYEFVENNFNRDPEFIVDELNVKDLSMIGILCVCSLMVYESLSNMHSVPLLENFKMTMNQLQKWLSVLKTDLYLIKTVIMKRVSTLSSMDVLKFIAFWKYYETISNDIKESIDMDEDFYLSYQLSINNERNDSSIITCFNFIYKNYCTRHILKGEIPALIGENNLGSFPIVEPWLSEDIEILSEEMKLVRYLHTKNDLVSLKKAERMKTSLQVIQKDLQQKHSSSHTSLVCTVRDLYYYNTVVHLQYLLMLQYEQIKDSAKLSITYKELMNLVKESIIQVLVSISNTHLLTVEFIYTKTAFILLDDITNIILALHQRCFFSFNHQTVNSDSATDPVKSLIKSHMNSFMDILQKVRHTLHTRAINTDQINPLATRSYYKITTMIEYMTNCELEYEAQIATNKHGQFGGRSLYDRLSKTDLADELEKLRELSDSIVPSNKFGDKQKYVAVSPTTAGITEQNFVNIFGTFFSKTSLY